MFSAKILAAFAAISSIAQGSPLPDTDTGVDMFKRDAPLDARDVELANLHKVNLTQMYKHSVHRRNDGDHVTIWVNRSFRPTEESEVDLEARGVRLVANKGGSGDTDACKHSSFRTRTGPNGPFTGGLLQLSQWGNDNRGSFLTSNNDWTDLVIAGSNSGSNAKFAARSKAAGNFISRVGTFDIRDLARDTERMFKQQFDGRWRAAGEGTMPCATNTFPWNSPINIIGDRDMDWSILGTSTRV
ncbi:hypothetical protein NLU13_9826 [Sarocladium strictum]|uniref:Uncharacterized protein n=1 Tax=Sarocladium strictum TaxID=5046 RepID=A0AA39L3K9_SARSR|nr:hypothetical protein NLU13_9826 [Sarocladium strictum]